MKDIQKGEDYIESFEFLLCVKLCLPIALYHRLGRVDSIHLQTFLPIKKLCIGKKSYYKNWKNAVTDKKA